MGRNLNRRHYPLSTQRTPKRHLIFLVLHLRILRYLRTKNAFVYLFYAKKYPTISDRVFRIKAWRCPTLTWGDPTLPLALSSFTSEFEMGSGGSYLLLPPGKLVAKTWSQSQDSDPNFHETGKPRYIFIFSVTAK